MKLHALILKKYVPLHKISAHNERRLPKNAYLCTRGGNTVTDIT